MNTSAPLETGRRERRKQETLHKLMTAAIQLFATQGYANTAVEDITEKADVGKGTFFNYFPTKDALLLAIFDALAERFMQFRLEIPKITDVRKALTEFTHGTLQEPSRSPKIIQGVFGTALTEPAIGKRLQEVIMVARKTAVGLFEHGQKMGQVRTDIPAALLGRNYQQFIFGTQIMWTFAEQEDLHVWVDTMLEIFWTGAHAPSQSMAPTPKKKSPEEK
jgi:AcrR family transcriptional regulator